MWTAEPSTYYASMILDCCMANSSSFPHFDESLAYLRERLTPALLKWIGWYAES